MHIYIYIWPPGGEYTEDTARLSHGRFFVLEMFVLKIPESYVGSRNCPRSLHLRLHKSNYSDVCT